MAVKMSVATALCVAVALVAVLVLAEDAGWQDKANVVAEGAKERTGDSVEGAKSWTNWAVGKISEKFNEEDKQKLGEVKENVKNMASDTHDKVKEAYGSAKGSVSDQAQTGKEAYVSAKGSVSDQAQSGKEAYESAKGSVSDQAQAGYEAAKEKTAEGAEMAGMSGHTEL